MSSDSSRANAPIMACDVALPTHSAQSIGSPSRHSLPACPRPLTSQTTHQHALQPGRSRHGYVHALPADNHQQHQAYKCARQGHPGPPRRQPARRCARPAAHACIYLYTRACMQRACACMHACTAPMLVLAHQCRLEMAWKRGRQRQRSGPGLPSLPGPHLAGLISENGHHIISANPHHTLITSSILTSSHPRRITSSHPHHAHYTPVTFGRTGTHMGGARRVTT